MNRCSALSSLIRLLLTDFEGALLEGLERFPATAVFRPFVLENGVRELLESRENRGLHLVVCGIVEARNEFHIGEALVSQVFFLHFPALQHSLLTHRLQIQVPQHLQPLPEQLDLPRNYFFVVQKLIVLGLQTPQNVQVVRGQGLGWGLGQYPYLLTQRKNEPLVERKDLGVVLFVLICAFAELQKRTIYLLEFLHHLVEEGYEVLLFELVHICTEVNCGEQNELERVGKQVEPVLHDLPSQWGTPEVAVLQEIQRFLEVEQVLSPEVEEDARQGVLGWLFLQVAVQVLLVIDDFCLEYQVRQEVLRLFFFNLLEVVCLADETNQVVLVQVQHQVNEFLPVNQLLQHKEVALSAVVFVGNHDLIKQLVIVVRLLQSCFQRGKVVVF